MPAAADELDQSIAVCQEWVLSRFGSEQVAGRIAQALDVRDVYTFAAAPEVVGGVFPGRRVRTSRIGRTAFARRHWRWLLPLMSLWWKRLDLSAYDVVVTSSHATVNSIRVRPGALHISYCYTPMRYAWMWRSELGRFPALLRHLWPVVAAILRRGDRNRVRGVDYFIAISAEVARRIRRYYGKESIILYPPIDTAFFAPDARVPKEDFFLYAGRLVAYKRPDIAVQAAQRAGVRLVVAGSGPELPRLRRSAGPEVEFVCEPSNEVLRDLYRRARALVFPGVEDFGMVLVEAQACGTPVIAYRHGGALEAVLEGETGSLYADGSVDGLAAALRSFDPARYDPIVLRRHAECFGADRFDEAIRTTVLKLTSTGTRKTA